MGPPAASTAPAARCARWVRRRAAAATGAPLGSGRYSATDAFSYGWAKFKAKPGELLVPILVVWSSSSCSRSIVQLILRATLLGTHDCTRRSSAPGTTQCGPSFFVSLLGAGLAGLVVSLIAQALGAGLIKNALNVADGSRCRWARSGLRRQRQVIVAALIVAVATAIGTLLCYLPGIIVGFLLNWTMFYVVDQAWSRWTRQGEREVTLLSHLDPRVFLLASCVSSAPSCAWSDLLCGRSGVLIAAHAFRQASPAPR